MLWLSALSYLTTKTLGAVVGDIGPLFILDNRMMMFLDQNCLLFHVITAVSSDIDDMVFKKLFKDCIDVIASSDTSHANYDRNTTHSHMYSKTY